MALLAEQELPQLGFLCTEVAKRIQKGGRTYFTGEGTSGRLGIVDAAETPPTYGVEDKIFDVIAGATALQNEVENAGDYKNAGWEYYRSLVLTARM